jgi:hypothetical protein
VLVDAFVHTTLLVRSSTRDAVEHLVEARPEVLALSPQGSGLRIVVDRDRVGDFRAWLTSVAADVEVDTVKPDFEDVFLGLLRDPQAIGGEVALA